MVVYGHRSFVLEPRRFLSHLHRRLERASGAPPRDELVSLLVDVGEAEAAVADAVMPESDGDAGELAGWREVARGIATANCACRYGEAYSIASALHRARSAVERLVDQPMPDAVRARAAEGFAFYALYPNQYIDAAEKLLARRRLSAVFCLGLRSIGSILAHLVAASLERHGVRVVVRSVRPRGHPFDRRLCIQRSLEQLIETSRCDMFAIVDEGPGLSGSSFAAAAESLHACGVSSSQVVLVPAWNAESSQLMSARAARVWTTHARVMGTCHLFERHASMHDWSAGRWRASVFTDDHATWPASQPQHERPKFVNADARTICRFAGLGKFGGRRLNRAEALHAGGFGPRPRSLRHGMLELDWIDGVPARAITPGLLDQAAAYLTFVRRSFALGVPDDIEELCGAIDVNSREAGLAVDPVAAMRRLGAQPGERVAVDGRMLLHEWIDTGAGFVKADALDHHDDDFLPGCRDIAWDAAGACVEWRLGDTVAADFIERYERQSGDRIAHRLPFYEAAYAAYRLGYARTARRALGGEEAARFARLEQKYADRLRRFQRCA